MNVIDIQPNSSKAIDSNTLTVMPVDEASLKKMISDAVSDMQKKYEELEKSLRSQITSLMSDHLGIPDRTRTRWICGSQYGSWTMPESGLLVIIMWGGWCNYQINGLVIASANPSSKGGRNTTTHIVAKGDVLTAVREAGNIQSSVYFIPFKNIT